MKPNTRQGLCLTMLLCIVLVCYAVSTPQPINKSYVFKAADNEDKTIFWTCFPIVDSTLFMHDMYNNSLGNMFEESISNAPNNRLYDAEWFSSGYSGLMYYTGVFWLYTDKRVWPQDGYKLTFLKGEVDTITVVGYTPDPDNTFLFLRGKQNPMLYQESWLGYFLPQAQSLQQAFSRTLDSESAQVFLDYIYSIKTQNKATCRVLAEKDSPWIINPSRIFLKEGDMAVVKILPWSPETMRWNTAATAFVPTPKTTKFTAQQRKNYTPVFIEFDPSDLPEEVGIYVAGICKGAAVVDSALIEVNYYAAEAKDDAELEIMFYYGDKGMKKAPAAYVYNPETMLFEAGSLQASNLGEYGYISFNRNEGSSLVPLVTELKQNYPNPFKGQTNISWILAKDAPVSLDIYNLKGQKVKTLFSGMGVKGRQMAQWNGHDENNREVASGVYFYRLNTPEGVKVHKMMVLR